MKYFLVFSTVIITILSSLLLDYAAEFNEKLNTIVLGIIGIAFVLNILKFVVWGWIHKKFDVSKSYPLTSIFFPLIFIVAYFKGDSEFSITKIIGVVLIVAGLIFFENKQPITK